MFLVKNAVSFFESLKQDLVNYIDSTIRNMGWFSLGDVVAQWLVRRTWDLKVESSSPGRCTHVVLLAKHLTLTVPLSPALMSLLARPIYDWGSFFFVGA